MRLNKLYPIFAALGLFFIAYIGTGFPSESVRAASAEPADHKTDRLFRELGIINIPHIPPPVDFSLLDLNGNKITLSDLKGKIVFLNFWTTWCPDCRVEMPDMEKLHIRLKGRDFAMVAVNIQEPDSRVKHFVEEYQLTFTVLLDAKGKIGRQFGIRAIPATFILDKNGGIIGRAFGSRPWNGKKSIALFEHLINRVVDNTDTNEHEQKKSISSNSVESDYGIGNSADNPTYTA